MPALGSILLPALLLLPGCRELLVDRPGGVWRRNPVEARVTKPLAEGPRTARYLALFNASAADYFRLDARWFVESTLRDETEARERTNAVGALAFCYRTPGCVYHEDAEALARLRTAYSGVAAHVSAQGKFTWERQLNEHGYETQAHEHAWLVEPLLLGYVWIRDRLPPEERAGIEAALKRASAWLYEHPLTEANNRGVIWMTVLTMSGLYFDEPEWVSRARQYERGILDRVILDGGAIGEHTAQYAGGGPDGSYGYMSAAYAYLYALWSGSEPAARRLEAGARWLVGFNTLSGWPVVPGASVRVGDVRPVSYRDVLPLFEWMSGSDPLYGLVLEKALEKLEGKLAAHYRGGSPHVVSPLIWAMLQESETPAPAPVPAWQAGRTELFSHPNVHYALIGRRYQTGIVFRARRGVYRDIPAEGMPMRGLQSWAWGDEPPVILPETGGGAYRASFTEAGGVSTARTDVSHRGGTWEVVHRTTPDGSGGLTTIIERRETLWTVYAFTPAATVAVYGGPDGPYRTSWHMNPDVVGPHFLNAAGRRVEFGAREGRLYYLRGDARPFRERVQVTAPEGPLAFGFSNAGFAFGADALADGTLTFSDESGRYALDLRGVLAGGEIDRAAGNRLTRVP